MQVIGVSSLSRDKTPADLDAFLKEAGATYPVALDTGRKLYSSYKVGPIPDMAFIKDGKILFHDHPARMSDEQLEAFLAQ